MKRWLVRICVLLILGAIVNVAVAWACACWCDVHGKSRNLPEVWPVAVDSEWPTEPWLAFQYRGTGVRETHAYARVDREYDIVGRVVVLSSGLPLPSVYATRSGSEHSQAHTDPMLYAFARCRTLWDGIAISERVSSQYIYRCLPTRPLWPGFAINTVFYAVGGWLLFAGPFVVRRWRRIRRGLCPKCAYDLRGSSGETCPECGNQVAARRVERASLADK